MIKEPNTQIYYLVNESLYTPNHKLVFINNMEYTLIQH